MGEGAINHRWGKLGNCAVTGTKVDLLLCVLLPGQWKLHPDGIHSNTGNRMCEGTRDFTVCCSHRMESSLTGCPGILGQSLTAGGSVSSA